MTPGELAAVAFVRRVLESARERAGKVGDVNLHSYLTSRLAVFTTEIEKERLRRRVNLAHLPGVVLRVLPACGEDDLRGILASALITCQCLLPNLPAWVIVEVTNVEEWLQKSVRHFEGSEK